MRHQRYFRQRELNPKSSLTEVLFDGTVTLPRGAFVLTAYNSGKSYAVMNPTPLGVLHAIAESEGWVYNVTDKNTPK